MAIISQGFFTNSGGADVILPIVSDVDFIWVKNTTIAAASQTTAVGVEYYWQRGFPAGAMLAYFKSNAANAANLTQYLTTGGFTLIDTSVQTTGALNNGSTGISAITNATPPVVTVGSTAGMAAGNIVRLIDVVGADEFSGIDFTIGYNTFSGTQFDLSYMVAGGVGTGGDFRVIPFDPIYYPRRRYVASISQASQAVIVTTVTHGYKVGQQVSFRIPDEFDMTEMNNLVGTITAVNTSTTVNSFTVNIDSSAFTAFAWPADGNLPFTPAQVIPVGEDTAYAVSQGVDILSDATTNTAFIGIKLAGGASKPGGANGNVMYWVAGKSDSVNSIVPA